MKSAVTICLVPEAAKGPFVFHDGLEHGCRAAAEAGFTAVEIFPADAYSFPADALRPLLAELSLTVAAVGTGAGWVRQRLSLVAVDDDVRRQAVRFIGEIIDVAAEFNAPAIIGSMQGQAVNDASRPEAIDRLTDGLAVLAARAARYGQPLLYEPLNRSETNLFNQQLAAADFLNERGLASAGVKLLCDLFHMSSEEEDLAATLRQIGGRPGDLLGHVHWADSNRQAMGFGQTDAAAAFVALKDVGYDGYLSAEVFPQPSAAEAARQTIASIESLHAASA
jgi:sugar phosphate isomerase/epimerase